MPKFVQAWEVTTISGFSGYVYDQHRALKMWGEGGPGATMDAVTIIRHEDGTRSYFKGCMAAEVEADWVRRGKA